MRSSPTPIASRPQTTATGCPTHARPGGLPGEGSSLGPARVDRARHVRRPSRGLVVAAGRRTTGRGLATGRSTCTTTPRRLTRLRVAASTGEPVSTTGITMSSRLTPSRSASHRAFCACSSRAGTISRCDVTGRRLLHSGDRYFCGSGSYGQRRSDNLTRERIRADAPVKHAGPDPAEARLPEKECSAAYSSRGVGYREVRSAERRSGSEPRSRA